MNGRSLIATGGIAALLAAICCATPILAIILGAIGLTAWIANADYIVLAMLVLGIGLTGLGLYRRHVGGNCATAATNPPNPK